MRLTAGEEVIYPAHNKTGPDCSVVWPRERVEGECVHGTTADTTTNGDCGGDGDDDWGNELA